MPSKLTSPSLVTLQLQEVLFLDRKLTKTLSNVIFSRYRESFTATVADLLFYLLNVKIDDTNNGSKISSIPNCICRCINGQPDCSDPPSPYEVSVFPGQTVGVSLVAVGQRNGSVPAPITALKSCKLHKINLYMFRSSLHDPLKKTGWQN